MWYYTIVTMEHATLHAYVTILHSSSISATPILLGNLTGIPGYTNVLYCSRQKRVPGFFLWKKRRIIPLCFYMETRRNKIYAEKMRQI